MLPEAASAFAEMAAAWGRARRALFDQATDARPDEALFRLHVCQLDPVSGNGAGDEHDPAVLEAADAVTFRRKGGDFDDA